MAEQRTARRRTLGPTVLLGTLVAIAIAIPLVRPQKSGRVEAPAAGPPTESAPSRADLVAKLATFEPPEYRPSESRDSFFFSTAMNHYRSADYEEAATALVQLPPDPDVLFYLGISNLATGRLTAGVNTLQTVIELNDPTYEEDARFFLSKALLYRRDIAAARAELERVAALNGTRAREARELIAAIEKLPPA